MTPVPFKHSLQAGDHVFRWTSIIIYPIQVHGIVLSTGEGIVTIVDFGLSASVPKSEQEADVDSDVNRVVQHCQEEIREEDASTNETRSLAAMGRVSIVILSEENEIKRWKRIDYGEVRIDSDTNPSIDSNKKSWWPWSNSNDKNCEAEQSKTSDEMKRKRPDPEKVSDSVPSDDDTSNKPLDAASIIPVPSTSKKPNEDLTPCKSDPTFLVLARVRYILMHPEMLPPHHVIFSNSECIAVWCKTGRWSTFQASFFLQSTAAGQIKSAVTLAAYVGSQTVPVTVPATGVLGWLGFTTTSTMSLLSVQPWILPAIAGYGLITVATPVVILLRAKSKWEETTIRLGDGFWAWADSDIFVQAVLNWK